MLICHRWNHVLISPLFILKLHNTQPIWISVYNKNTKWMYERLYFSTVKKDLIHIFSCILHHLRVCYEVLKWPAPSWGEHCTGPVSQRSWVWILCKPEFFFRLYGNFMTARVVCLHTHHSMSCWQSHTDCILLCTSGQEIKMKSTKWTFSN